MTARQPLPPETPAAFTTSQAMDLGISRSRLRAADLTSPWRGVHTEAGADQRLRALAQLLPEGAAFSHSTALLLWDLPVPDRLTRNVHISVPSLQQVRRPGVVAHRVPVSDTRTLGSLVVTTADAAWADVAPRCTTDELIILGDAMMTRWPNTKAALTRIVDRRAGARGIVRLRDALGDIRKGAESPKETELRLLLVRAGLPEPELNPELWSDTGVYLGRGDLVWRDLKVLVEYDGDYHRTEPERWAKDRARIRRFQDAGWYTVVVTRYDLRRPAEVVSSVRHGLTLQASVHARTV